jgi:hypothetical protein
MEETTNGEGKIAKWNQNDGVEITRLTRVNTSFTSNDKCQKTTAGRKFGWGISKLFQCLPDR